MRNNILQFYDPTAQDAMARLIESRWQERRDEIIKEQRRAERARERKIKWCVNLALIVAMCAASFAAGLCCGVL